MSKKPIKRRLKNMSDVRMFLADITNRLNQRDIDAMTAGKLGYLLQILSRVIVDDDLEKRVKSLEEQWANEGDRSRSRGIRAV